MRVTVFWLTVATTIGAQTTPISPSASHPLVPSAGRLAEAKVSDSSATVVPLAPAGRTQSETLHFNVNWPSGLSLGEGEITSVSTSDGWSFSYHVDAGIPGFVIQESAKSAATRELCSTELSREGSRGAKKLSDKTVFDQAALTATRTTGKGGGKTEIRIGGCARDALAFMQFVRRELAAGRVPASQPVYYGSGYQTRLQYSGTQTVRTSTGSTESDRITAVIKGPATDYTIEMLFARDSVRTPVLIHIPLAMGKFSVEFTR